MSISSLAERLGAERHRRFVGRTDELKLFQSSLTAVELPFHVLHIFGPGGLGKTSLLGELLRICQQTNIPAIYIDARNLDPSPESFLNGLRFLMGLDPTTSPLQILSQRNARHVVFIDTYETLLPLDDWLREEFLPQLPEDTLIVLAGRNPPQANWRTDPGWQALLHTISLRNLSPEESRVYLTRRKIPVLQHQNVLDFTHGHPLALSLVADVFAQGHNIGFQPETAPDVVKTLLERFVQEVPTPTHRMALEACAMVRLMTETLLTQMLNLADVHELFEWLRGLSFMESGRFGLFPHDLAREVLTADLRWRNPDWYAELHRRARIYYTTRLGQTQGAEQHAVFFDYIYLHRDNPAVRPRFTWQENSSIIADTLRETDKAAILDMVTAREAKESAKIAAYWLEKQPSGVIVFRDRQQEPVGFMLMVALHEASLAELETDPGAIAAMRYLKSRAPLRSNEGATLFRFWMAKDTYQEVSPIQSLIFINFVQHHHNTSGLAFTFFVCADPDFWAMMFAYADLARLTEADFEVAGKRYGVYGHDWRQVSPLAWQELLAQREIAASAQIETSQPQISEPLLVLSQPEFIEALQDALRNYSSPNGLQNNPLLRSRLVLERVAFRPQAQVSTSERVATLQTLIKEAAESLQSSPRGAKSYRALHRTYLNPAPTQEQAAECLDLPFSTFRRHLKAGITLVSDILWQWEIGG